MLPLDDSNGKKQDGEEIARTAVMKNTLDPVFNEHFKIMLPDSCVNATLLFEVFDKDKAGRDSFLGMVQFQGNEILHLCEQGEHKNGDVRANLKRKPYAKTKTKVSSPLVK